MIPTASLLLLDQSLRQARDVDEVRPRRRHLVLDRLVGSDGGMLRRRVIVFLQRLLRWLMCHRLLVGEASRMLHGQIWIRWGLHRHAIL